VFIIVQSTGIYKHGFIGYFKNILPDSVPLPILIFMVPLEIISQLAKPFSLAMRLFANMFAGHAVMICFLSLIIIFKSYFIAPFPLVGNIIFSMFEILIAFIQAFIFTFLTSLYISAAQEGH
jgi:F-type H+-transporting ATPase subunit a